MHRSGRSELQGALVSTHLDTVLHVRFFLRINNNNKRLVGMSFDWSTLKVAAGD
jgi:hypothetical protein